MKTQNGNALFLILIAVALFAALSYAVTQSGRGGSGIDKEQAQISAAQIIQYAAQVESSIQRLKLINTCADAEISFHYDSDNDGILETDGSDDYYNPNSPSDGSCDLFHINGSSLTWEDPSPDWIDPIHAGETYLFPSRTCIEDIGSNGTGAAATTFCNDNDNATDLMIVLPGLKLEICQEINKNISNSAFIPIDSGSHPSPSIPFVGSFSNGIEIGDIAKVLQGEYTYCYQADSTGSFIPDGYAFYHVILAR